MLRPGRERCWQLLEARSRTFGDRVHGRGHGCCFPRWSPPAPVAAGTHRYAEPWNARPAPLVARGAHHALAFATARGTQDSVGSDEEADALVTSFTSFFAEMRAGKRSSHTTRALVANFLTDESPTMLEKFVELWDTCRTTNAWAGLSLPVMDEDGLLAAPESMLRSASSVRRGDTMVVLAEATPSARQGSVRPRPRDERAERARDWQLWGRKLVPEGRGSYAIWFTIANLAVIIGIFAYMVGDYGMWIRQNEALFLDIGFSTETYAVRAARVRALSLERSSR